MSGHYSRRWTAGSSAAGSGRTTPTGRTNLSSTVEPSTYGTSWNSVRWNKPSTAGYRSHSARIRDTFESRPSYTSSSAYRATSAPKYNNNNAAQKAKELVSLGPTLTERASRFDATVQDKYRNEAREILSKYTSKDRTGAALSGLGYYSRHFEPKKLPDSSSSSRMSTSYTPSNYTSPSAAPSGYSRSSVTPTRTTVPTYTSRYSTERSGLTSASPQPKERPWRARMAESARLRATHGDDASASYTASRASRRNSLGQYRTSSRQSSVESSYGGGGVSRYSTPLSSVIDRYTAPRLELTRTAVPKPYMSRSFSPVRSPINPFPNHSTSRLGSTRSASPQNSHSAKLSSTETGDAKSTISAVPTTSPIQESVEKEEKKRRSSSKARTARRASRQRSQVKSSSSDEDDRDRRSESRQRRRTKKKCDLPKDVLPAPLPPESVLQALSCDMTKSLQTTKSKNEDEMSIMVKSAPSPSSSTKQPKEDAKDIASPPMLTATEDESFHTCSPTPPQLLSPTVVVNPSTEPTPIDTPLSVEVVNKTVQNVAVEYSPNKKKLDSPACLSWDSSFELVEPYSDASCVEQDDDESQYSAVAHFVPRKRRPPVPGMWLKDGAELISKNKSFTREQQSHTTFMIWKEKRTATVTKKVRMKAREEKKETTSIGSRMEDVKKMLFKPKRRSEIDQKEVERAISEREVSPVNDGKKKRNSSKDTKSQTRKPIESNDLIKAVVAVSSKEEVKKNEDKTTEETKTPPVPPKPQERRKSEFVPEKVQSMEAMTPPEKRRVEEKPIIKVEERAATPEPKVREVKIASVSATCALRNRVTASETAMKKLVEIVRIPISLPKPITVKRKPVPLALAVVDRELEKKASRGQVQKTLKQKSKQEDRLRLECRATTSTKAVVNSKLQKKQAETGKAQVTVISAPIKDVNITRLKLRCRATKMKKNRNSMPCFSTLAKESGFGMDYEKEKIKALQSNNGAYSDTEYDNDRDTPRQNRENQRQNREGSQAASILNEMRNTVPEVDWKAEKSGVFDVSNGNGALVLPDQSILEEYVKRKRGRLERLHSEPILEHEDESECDSPCNSTASELLPACAVRVFEPSPRGVPVITAPHKSRSRMSSVESQCLTPTRMLDTQTSFANNFNSTPQGFLRHDRRQVKPILFEAPKSFDTPKTPFEASLQKQANDIVRRASINSLSTYSEPGDCRPIDGSHPFTHSRQTSQDSNAAISTSFTAALAANQPTRHERYAAHIPVNRGEASGRQSTTSIDSSASGALEQATKQLDQVIDQARHRHHHQRSKFKEAIDYLDQIFEDLKKECDTGPGLEDTNNNSAKQGGTTVETAPPTPQSTAAAALQASSSATLPKEQKRFAPVCAPVPDPAPSNYASHSLPTRSAKHRPVKPPSPVEVVLNKPVPAKAKSPEQVSETIVLPKKQDKLDFTRKWLQDDLSAFSLGSPAPLVVGPEEAFYHDLDEHSLGSCSAEVAAINEKTKEKKKGSKPKPHADVKPVKPQVFRPQPVIQTLGTGPRQFPLELEPPQPSLSRVASNDRMSSGMDGWRGGSQEPYLSSHPSDPRPSPSAFREVPGGAFSRNSLRGSIKSLPDAGLIRPGPSSSFRPTPDPPRDPGLAIDALVAELELNTEEVRQHSRASAGEKRRSFPTTTGRYDYDQPRPRQQPVNPRRVTQPVNLPSQGYRNGYQQPPPHSQPILPSPHRSPRPPQGNKQSLDDMANMLNSMANEFGNGSMPHSASNHSNLNGNHHHGSTNQQPSVSYQAPPPRKMSAGGSSNAVYAVPHSMHAPPFETINKERIAPSRVEAMQTMFESRPKPNVDWRRGPQPFKAPSREEENYYDICEMQQPQKAPQVPTHHQMSPSRSHNSNIQSAGHHYPPHSSSSDFSVAQQHQQHPVYPQTQPPGMPPGRNGSAGSSLNGGYYSSNSSGHHPAYIQNSVPNRSSMIGKHSLSSRAPSAEDEDDGFYDNIQVFEDHRRISRGSEFDSQSLNRAASTKSHSGATASGGKIGSFFRKIGAGRPPGAAASLVSLNKAGVEPNIRQAGPLMKSSSLCQEPWKQEILGGPSLPRGDHHKKGLGQRLKNSLFGSKKRLN